MKKILSPLEKLLLSLASRPKHFANFAILRKSHAIRHHPDKEDLINLVWKRFAILSVILQLSFKIQKFKKFKSKIIFTPESLQKNKWTTFLDKLHTSNQDENNTLHISLFQILVQELILSAKGYQPFWTPAYKDLSEKLLLPIEIDSAGLDLTSSNFLFQKVEEKSSFLTINTIKVQNKNLQKTYYQLSTSTVTDKWVKEVINPSNQLIKALKIKLKPSLYQREIIDKWISTSNYVFNKTIECINNGDKINFQTLRDKLVTRNTKKTHPQYKDKSEYIKTLHDKKIVPKNKLKKLEKMDTNLNEIKKLIKIENNIITTLEELIKKENILLKNIAKTLDSERNKNVKDWECDTPKEVRASAVDDVCKAYKTGFSNLKAGNIKYFKMNFRKHGNVSKNVSIPKNYISITDGKIKLAPTFFQENCIFNMGKKTKNKYKNMNITGDCRIIKQKNKYWIVIPITEEMLERKVPLKYCGVDPGVRTFMTSFGESGFTEYKHSQSLLNKLQKKINMLKSLRTKTLQQKKRNKYRKRKINKVENKKENLINELHWKTINHLLKNNDYIFYGDIKSHNIVKTGINRNLNRSINDLKLFKFKERLLYKSTIKNKKVYLINESYTTKTCSSCGTIYNIGSSETYNCSICNANCGRDLNASKNSFANERYY